MRSKTTGQELSSTVSLPNTINKNNNNPTCQCGQSDTSILDQNCNKTSRFANKKIIRQILKDFFAQERDVLHVSFMHLYV